MGSWVSWVSNQGRVARRSRPAFEWLKRPDGARFRSQPDIVVGRSLSAYFIGDVWDHQETISYTVYNEQADPETGLLLTDTLRTRCLGCRHKCAAG